MMRTLALLIFGLTIAVGTPALAQRPAMTVGEARARPGLRGAQARLMAERGAQVTAARNLLARDAAAAGRPAKPNGMNRLSGVVRGHQYLPAQRLPDGRARVRIWLTQ